MCCFSQPILSVSATNIFARGSADGRQFLVYSMTLDAADDLAMVLPLPVKPGTEEQAVEFIDLSAYPDFFDDLQSCFPAIETLGDPISGFGLQGDAEPKLNVVQVGAFEASFVPKLKDFSRLDERYRISDRAWKKLPEYRDYGFAVFKLKSGAARIHPMAFSFPRRNPAVLFFPTVHIHDGEVHEAAEFDHTLYFQCSRPMENPEQWLMPGWAPSWNVVRAYMKWIRTHGVILPDQHCYRTQLRGRLPNRDTFVSMAA